MRTAFDPTSETSGVLEAIHEANLLREENRQHALVENDRYIRAQRRGAPGRYHGARGIIRRFWDWLDL